MAQQRDTKTIPRAPCARMLMAAGAKRVSADAADTFSDVIQGIADQIAQRAAKIAQHSGRKTVLDSDIKLAAKQ